MADLDWALGTGRWELIECRRRDKGEESDDGEDMEDELEGERPDLAGGGGDKSGGRKRYTYTQREERVREVEGGSEQCTVRCGTAWYSSRGKGSVCGVCVCE